MPVNGIVGYPEDIVCLIETTSELELSSVTSSWTGPNGVVTNDDRLTINVTVNKNIYITILHFEYLSENDEGNYTCSVTISNHTMLLSTTLNNLISKLINSYVSISIFCIT